MSRPSRRKALTGAAAAAAVSLLAPARARAAVETSGRLNIKEHPGGLNEAIKTGQPLYVPPGAYELSAGITLTQPLDLLGDAAQRPTFTLRGDDTFIAGAAPIRFQNCRFKGGDGYLVNMNETAVEVPYIGVFDCSFENSGGVIGWPTIHPRPGSKLHQLEVRRVSARNVRRGIMVQGGATVRFDVEDYECDGYKAFGLLVGPAGPGARDRQAEMESGTVRRVKVINGTPKHGDYNSNGVYIAGRNVELHEVYIENLGDGTKNDTEGLYTKVTNLRIDNVKLINAGGREAFYACKGWGWNTIAPLGQDGMFENMEIVCTGAHQGVGVWFQFARATFAKIKTVGLTRQALIMHQRAEGPLIIREWSDVDARRRSSVFKLRGPNQVEFINCSVSPPTANVIENVGGAANVVQIANNW